MGKNVAVFVDVANIFYAAKAAGVDIDYVTLLKAATAGRDFVRAYAYTGLDPDNENQRNFHAFLRPEPLQGRQQGHPQVRRRQGQGEPRHRARRRHDEDRPEPRRRDRRVGRRRLRPGDPGRPGDGRPGRGRSASAATRRRDLIEVADLFTDITQLARVDKGSSRSGRRVAGDDEDLSMTEVPDKQTEGTGQRGRGRGRGRGRPGEAEPVAAASRTGGRTSGSRRPPRPSPRPRPRPPATAPMTVLPGEKLSRVAAPRPRRRPPRPSDAR